MDTRILTMHRTQALNEQLAEFRFETSVSVDFIRALMNVHWRAECANALDELKEIDPLGWERWYDMEVDDGGWRYITEQVRKRIDALNNLMSDISDAKLCARFGQQL